MDVQWQFDLTTDEENACLAIEHSATVPKRMITLLRDYKTWVIRLNLAGGQRSVGFYSNAKTGNLYPAFRYADMVRMYFWPYKLRDTFEPADGDLNISAERANLDLVHEVKVVEIIKDIEAHLKSTGAIVAPAERETQLKEKNKGRWARPTLKGSLADMAEVHRLALAALRAEVVTLRKGMAGGFSGLGRLIRNQGTCLHMPGLPQPFSPAVPYCPPLQPSFVPGPYIGAPSTISATGEEEVEAAPCS